MDGNGRWARRVACPDPTGTARAWRRCGAWRRRARAGDIELSLFALLRGQLAAAGGRSCCADRAGGGFLLGDAGHCAENGRTGASDRTPRPLPAPLKAAIETAERVTSHGRRTLTLRIAVDYSGREAIVRAACGIASSLRKSPRQEFARRLGEATHAEAASRSDVDLLIRTGGERRLSDFLLWECAYAELVFTPRMSQPEFSGDRSFRGGA